MEASEIGQNLHIYYLTLCKLLKKFLWVPNKPELHTNISLIVFFLFFPNISTSEVILLKCSKNVYRSVACALIFENQLLKCQEGFGMILDPI